MTRFVLVRHGQTEWNRVERFRGRADIPLNETGLAQAKALARRLASWAIAAVYSSPLQRTRETGKAIARQLGLQVEPLEGLIDIDYGALQGLTPEEASGTRISTANGYENPTLSISPRGKAWPSYGSGFWNPCQS